EHRPAAKTGDRFGQRLRGRRRQRAADGVRPYHRQGERGVPPGGADDGQLRCGLWHLVSGRPGGEEARKGNLVSQPEDERSRSPADGADQQGRAGCGTEHRHARDGAGLGQGGIQCPPWRGSGPVAHGARPAAARLSGQRRIERVVAGVWGAAQAGSGEVRSLNCGVGIPVSTILTLHDPQTAREYYREGLWQQHTLYSLVRDNASARPAAFALRDAVHRLTWGDLLAWVDSVAEDMHLAGVRRGERVSLWIPSRVESVVTFLACSRNGYVCNPSMHQNY